MWCVVCVRLKRLSVSFQSILEVEISHSLVTRVPLVLLATYCQYWPWWWIDCLKYYHWHWIYWQSFKRHWLPCHIKCNNIIRSKSNITLIWICSTCEKNTFARLSLHSHETFITVMTSDNELTTGDMRDGQQSPAVTGDWCQYLITPSLSCHNQPAAND